MDQLKAAVEPARFPTLPARRMALKFLESGRPVYSGEGVRPTAAPDVWQMVSASQRVLALYKTSTVIAAARSAVGDAAGGLEVRLLPPGAPAEEEAREHNASSGGPVASISSLPALEVRAWV